jgi:5-methyltetrahydrofolate--homocysteine methyltransferase
MNNLFKILDEKQYILADGATGTNLFAMGLETGNPPEPWNIDHKDRIRALHQGFVDAGSDLILTNSFGGNSFRLKLHNLESQVFELNQTAAMIAREVADEAGRTVVVAGAIGPTGEIIEPHGLMTAKQATDAFKIQAEGLVEGGVDVLWLETMYSIEELEAAIEAVKEFDIPVCATMSFDTAGKTMMGVTPAELAKRSQGFGLFGVGGNCGVGAPDLLAAIIDINRNMTDDTIIIAKANCGIPEFHDGSIVYSGTEELMAEYVHLALNSGARIVGGCCGTSFKHIRAMRKAMDKHKMKDLPDLQEIEENVGQLSAGSKAILTGQSATVKKQRRSRRSR